MSATTSPGERVSPLWEQLVTDGHVRAARIRWMRPWIIAFGALVILLGFYLQMKVRPAYGGGNAPAALAALAADVNRARAPVHAAMSALPKVSDHGLNLGQMAAAAELPQVIDIVLADLKQQDSFNKQHINIQEVSSRDFWRGPWPAYHLISTSGPNVKLVGGIVKTQTAGTFYYYSNQPTVQRWIGAFRKRHGSWQYATVTGIGLYAVPNRASVSADLIPITLKPLLPKDH